MKELNEIAQKYYEIALENLTDKDPQAAVQNFSTASDLFAEANNLEMVARCISKLSIAHSDCGNTSAAISCFSQGLAFISNHQIPRMRHIFFNNIGDQFLNLGNYDIAVHYFNMSYAELSAFLDEIDDSDVKTLKEAMVVFINLAICNLKLNKLDDTDFYLESAKSIAMKVQFNHFDFTIGVIKAALEFKRGNRDYLEKNIDALSSSLSHLTGSISDYIMSISELLDLLVAAQMYDYGEKILNSVIAHGKNHMNEEVLLEAHRLSMDFYKAIGNQDKYQESAVNYALDHRTIKSKKTQILLNELDTSIALAIAENPEDFI